MSRWAGGPAWARVGAGLAVAGLAVLAAGLVARLAAAPPRRVEIAGYATSMRERTPGQRRNARLAAEALDGQVVGPGAVFSFNRTVRSWTADQGYVKAPVSYDGEMIPAFGGGVCQTSTTLYNAALLAGLPIVERHRHVYAPHYVTPGRDAAVAQPSIDLRFRNPYPWPLVIRAAATRDRLDIRLVGEERPTSRAAITTEVLSTARPRRLARSVVAPPGSRRAFVRNPGATGYRVVTYRTFTDGAREVGRERLSDDSYTPMDRVVQLDEAPAP